MSTEAPKNFGEEPHKESKEAEVIVGTVAQLWLYPVKSMRGLAVEQANVGYTGLEGDRRYAFLQSESKSAFPWLTARNLPEMVLYSPEFTEPDNPKKSPINVKTPEGKTYAADSEELMQELAEKSKRKLQRLHLGRGAYDAMPLSLLSDTAKKNMDDLMDKQLDVRRFRPNIEVAASNQFPDFENSFLGRDIVIGEGDNAVRISLDLKDPRCKIPNIDPYTGEIDKNVIKTLENQFGNLFGLYATVKKPGLIRVGDSIRAF